MAMPTPTPNPPGGPARVLADLGSVVAAADPQTAGVLWRLAENPRGLDANLVRLRPGAVIAEHTDTVLDVLLIVLEGAGELGSPGGRGTALGARTVLWLPRSARRSLRAGPAGMLYVTVHTRRPGLSITPAPGVGGRAGTAGVPDTDEGGEAACLLDRVCPDCGRIAGERSALYCSRCGSRLPH
ncbi:cupin domain-containing protein [Streptomyces sp. NPDC002138]|uniref:cupin domain-containing protein n=1 Tax=Streptomyces sp. NPDC002138 TaxID=3154410 RepID=UPI00331B5E3C